MIWLFYEMQELQFPNIVDKSVKCYTHFGRVLSVSYIVRHTYDLIILGFFPWIEMNTCLHKNLSSSVHGSFIQNSQMIETT